MAEQADARDLKSLAPKGHAGSTPAPGTRKHLLDQRLRKDVRFLTTLLGDTVREQEGEGLFQVVERIRHLAREIRANPGKAPLREMERAIRSLTLEEAYKVARAFTIFFQLVNIAEEAQRIRRIREHEAVSPSSLDMSIGKLFRDIARAGVGATFIKGLLKRVRLGLVLTAHPTEAKRRSVLNHLLYTSDHLARLESERLTPAERSQMVEEIKGRLEILWQTRETRRHKVGVIDEVKNILFYFQRTILELVPQLHLRILQEFRAHYPGDHLDLSQIIRFSSWAGGDRDGNPLVTPEVTKQTVKMHRDLILRHYIDMVERLTYTFSQSTTITDVSRQLKDSIRADLKLSPELIKGFGDFDDTESYRKKFFLIGKKLANTLIGTEPCYQDEALFLQDLEVIRESLDRNRGNLAARTELERLILQVKVFGFHLASLEIREHSGQVRAAGMELLKAGGISGPISHLGETELEAVLVKELLRQSGPPVDYSGLSRKARRVLEQFQMMADIRRLFGPKAAENYILSFTRRASDILMILLLAKAAGLVRVSNGSGVEGDLNIVPLFETIDDLREATRVMGCLFSNPLYRGYLKGRGDHQEIMLGYSDSNRLGGYLAANWALYQAQRGLCKLAQDYQVELTLFHGKGGTIDRGGGQSHRSILAQPYAAPGGRIKVTEQGEVVSLKYSNPVVARRNIEQLLSAVVMTNLTETHPREEGHIRRWGWIMERLSDLSYQHYRALVYDPHFLDYYEKATPIEVIQWARIGSRPARRRSDLRAIPWVASWIQCRQIISGWYGAGFALDGFVKEGKGGLRELQTMYRRWPFFASLIDNLQLTLAKVDMYIAEKYASLVEERRMREKIFGLISQEYERTVALVLAITGQREILDNHPVLKESIRLRNPYVDPLNYLQVRFLKEWRRVRRRNILDLLLLTVNGIAFGMKSTG